MRARGALVPASLLALGVAVSAFLLRGQPAARTGAPEPAAPLVHVLPAEPETLRLRVRSQGTVAPRTESDLVAEVSGQVLQVEPGLEPGAFFQAGDLLARLDPRDLELAVERARASLARARAEEEYARATYERQRALQDRGIASASVLDESRRAARIAEARRREAELDLEAARTDLSRTEIVAPFDGRTRSRGVDVGGYVSVGTPVASIYAVDYAEVRLPLPDAELAYLDLDLGSELPLDTAPEVVLEARFAGRELRWSGRLVRTEAEIDPRTRMVHVIARVPRPYESEARPPLSAGLFVEAEILGRRVEGVFRVPRAALDDAGELWVVDRDDRLRRRRVDVLRFERDSALIAGGLEPRERVSLLEPRLAREGLAVRAVHEDVVARSDEDEEPAS